MKNVWLLILFLFVSLLGAKALNDASSHECEKEYALLVEDDSEIAAMNRAIGYILPVSLDLANGDMLIADSLSLAGQLRTCGRTFRVITPYSLVSKVVAWRTALMRENKQSSSFTRFYSTLPYPCWEVASEHYIFGMRRILI